MRSDSDKESKKIQSNPWMAVVAALHIAFLQQMVGINVIVTYGSKIVGEVAPDQKKLIMIIINFLPAVAAIFTTYVLTKYGRKTILQAGTLGVAVVLAVCFIGYVIKSKSEVVF